MSKHLHTTYVTIFGNTLGEYGMPSPYYFYHIVEGPAVWDPSKKTQLAMIMCFTDPGPMPGDNFARHSGTEVGEATKKAVAKLKEHPQMRNLKVSISGPFHPED